MATQITGVKLDTKILDRMTAEIKPMARAVVQKYGWAIASEAAQRAPVDTSALRNSILSESKMTGDMEFTVQDGVEPAIESWREKFLAAFAELLK